MAAGASCVQAMRMTARRRNLQRIGLLALGVGLGLAVVAPAAGPDIGALLRGYSVLLVGTAAYLVAGLRLLTWRARQAASRSASGALVRQA